MSRQLMSAFFFGPSLALGAGNCQNPNLGGNRVSFWVN